MRSPIVVVPPDMRERDMGEGPIVALTRLAEESVSACRFASRLARALGRPLAFVHVQQPSSRPAASASAEGEPLGSPRGSEALLDHWSEAHGLRPDSRAVLHGEVVERAIEFADEQRAPLLVTEGRRPSTLEQVLRRSTSTALAALAPLPVAVVPSPGAHSR